ncbi:hypothetical protein O3M35_002842 [Rhynocoris fuscipes]|uniref:BRCA2 OB1 domain-containing protein n=1 Tax=Rhynocoris fuscipes TaxID=488301 RepID=A0AAW1CUF3_9HEMI
MVEFIKKGLIKIGTKLAIMGAELINPEQPCDPLKAGNETRMKFYTNSCRRVKWNVKMGFLNKYRLPAMRLSSILPNGGFIGDLKAVVARVYPILHMSKDSEGKTG